MPDSSDQPEAGGTPPARRRSADVPPKAPRWVTISVIGLAILVLLVVAMMLTGGGHGHGPGRHTGAAGYSVTAIDEPTGRSTEPVRP
jgi:hypothetical protein